MELHQVLQRIFLPLLLVKAGVFDLIQIAHRLKHHPALMVLVRYIPVVLEHQFLVLLLELSIINKLILTGFRLWRQYWCQYLGYIFFRGISPSKMGPFAPF
jgi:hypothetical protein